MNIVNIEENLHIFWTTGGISGKMWLMIMLSYKKQGFTLSLKNTFWRNQRGVHIDPPAFLGLILAFDRAILYGNVAHSIVVLSTKKPGFEIRGGQRSMTAEFYVLAVENLLFVIKVIAHFFVTKVALKLIVIAGERLHT